MMNQKEILEKIRMLADKETGELKAIRRDLHMHAETGWLEIRTSSLIAERLTELGYEVLTGEDVCLKESRMGLPSQAILDAAYERALAQGAEKHFAERAKDGQTGVIGILRCGPGPVVAMRFDIDALGVVESEEEEHRPAREGFRSINRGAMHACGHDGHTAIGLGTAEVLIKIREQLSGTIKLIFQPAEEGVRGAKSIVDKGHLQDVDYFLSSHLSGRKMEDGVDVVAGYAGGLATTKYDVFFRGKAAHAGGTPEDGHNAILAAAAAIQNLYAIPRHSAGASRINVGTIHGGSGRNVIADEVKLEMEVRGSDSRINDYMEAYALRVIEHAAAMHQVESSVKLMGAAGSLAATPALMDRIRRVCTEGLNLKVSDKVTFEGMGSEDVSYMMKEVQTHGGEATFMRIMLDTAGPFHSRTFDIDEGKLPLAVKVFSCAVYDICGKKEE